VSSFGFRGGAVVEEEGPFRFYGPVGGVYGVFFFSRRVRRGGVETSCQPSQGLLSDEIEQGVYSGKALVVFSYRKTPGDPIGTCGSGARGEKEPCVCPWVFKAYCCDMSCCKGTPYGMVGYG
jgi:hypothetical protein